MSIIKIDELIIDNPKKETRSLELWWGDVSNISSKEATDFLVVSYMPKSTNPFCPNSVGGCLVNRGLNLSTLGASKSYWPAMPVVISNTIPTTPGIEYGRILYFSPSISGFKTGEAAPYQSDFIFRALDCFQAGAPTTVTMPLVSCGKLSGAGQGNPSLILRMLFHSACKWGGKEDFKLNTIRIVLHSKSATLASEFADMKKNYLNLINSGNYPTMPPSHGMNYAYYANNTLAWIAKNKGTGWPDQISDLQVFGIHMYTTSYFHAMNDNLRLIDKKLPAPGGIGYTDLNNPLFKQLQPLFAVTSAGLMNLPKFVGLTFRGVDPPLWNPFKVGSSLRILSYMSSSAPMTSVTAGHPILITSNSINSRNISYYSKNPPEKEHLYDKGTEEKVTSNVTTPKIKIGVDEIDHKYCT